MNNHNYKRQQYYHERITINPYMQTPHARGVEAAIETKAVIETKTNNNPESDLNNANLNVLLSARDSLLLSILERMKLESFSVSISDSSDDSMYQSDINILHSDSKTPLTFPVGTAIRYKKEFNSTVGADVDVDENALLRLLSSSGLLCQNVQLDDKLRSIHPTSTGWPSSSTQNVKTPYDNTRIIIIPNDAFTLCHSRSLHKMIVSSSPCHDKAGVFSNFDFDTLNQGNVFHKATWMSVQKEQNSKNNENGFVRIDWGIRFQKRLLRKNHASLSDVMMDESLSSSSLEDANLQHCPLTTSSTIYIWDSNAYRKHDLKMSKMSMNNKLISFDDMDNYRNNELGMKMGVERHILRPSGIAHYGTFQSRFYFRCENDNDNVCQSQNEEGVSVSVLEHYPSIVRPVFHSFKAFLVVEKSKDMNSLQDASNTVTELIFNEQNNHHLELSMDGSTSLSFTTHLPPQSSLFIQMDYEPRYIPFELFPADPNRGFDVPPSYAYFSTSNPMLSSPNVQLYSNALLIMPPVPDMSMPFNVISLCGTCFAIIIGTSINMIIKKSSQGVSDTLKGVEKKTRIKKLKERIKSKISMVKEKFTKAKKKQPKVKIS